MKKLICAALVLAGIAFVPSLKKEHGVVIEKTYEGWAESNDYYIIAIGEDCYEVEADDLEVGDPVTVFSHDGEHFRTLYGWR